MRRVDPEEVWRVADAERERRSEPEVAAVRQRPHSGVA
jgi:hypothetical protein